MYPNSPLHIGQTLKPRMVSTKGKSYNLSEGKIVDYRMHGNDILWTILLENRDTIELTLSEVYDVFQFTDP